MRSFTDPPGLNASSFAVELDVEALGHQAGETDHRRVADVRRDVDRDCAHSLRQGTAARGRAARARQSPRHMRVAREVRWGHGGRRARNRAPGRIAVRRRPELAEALDERQLAEARLRAIVPVADLAAGVWPAARLRRATAQPFAIMVVEGIVLRELLLAGSTATELLGPGDVVDFTGADDALLPTDVRWSVPDAARIMVLDDRLLAILRTWPGVARVLLSRAVQRERRLSTHRAIAQLPRVDLRLLAFFGHLGERWGRVTPTGVLLPLHLTHETLGRLIGARRPTVSLALKDLAAGNMLERRQDGAWLLRYEALQLARRARRDPRRLASRGGAARRGGRERAARPARTSALRSRRRTSPRCAPGSRRSASPTRPACRAPRP